MSLQESITCRHLLNVRLHTAAHLDRCHQHSSPGVSTLQLATVGPCTTSAAWPAGPQLSLDKVRVTGTPAYMAPEAVRGRQAQDKQPDSKAEREKTASLGSYDALKADAWGVGAIIFYAATGHQLLFDGIESVASSGSHAFSAAAHQTPTLQPGHAASAAAGPRTPDDHAGSQPVLKSGSGDTAKNSGSSDAFINDMLLEEHSRCKVCHWPWCRMSCLKSIDLSW